MASQVGKGAKFWAYISPQNNTAKAVTKWQVTITQQDGSWIGNINSTNPTETLQTPGLSGTFNVVVVGSGPGMPARQLSPLAPPADIGCNANCASMVGIVATPDGQSANYWTTWDAYCEKA